MKKDQVREALQLRALGLLSGEEQQRLDERLARCNESVELSIEEQKMLADFDVLRERSPVTVDVRDRVLREVAGMDPRAVERGASWQFLASAAAAILAAFGVAWGFKNLWPSMQSIGQQAWSVAATLGATALDVTGGVVGAAASPGGLESISGGASWTLIPLALTGITAASLITVASIGFVLRPHARRVRPTGSGGVHRTGRR